MKHDLSDDEREIRDYLERQDPNRELSDLKNIIVKHLEGYDMDDITVSYLPRVFIVSWRNRGTNISMTFSRAQETDYWEYSGPEGGHGTFHFDPNAAWDRAFKGM